MSKDRPKLKKLSPSLVPTITAFVEVREAKRTSEANARSSEKLARKLQDRILREMGGDEAAACGEFLLAVKRDRPVEAQLTLTDQTTIAWSDVTRIIVGNREIQRSEVVTLYGGKAGPVSLLVSKLT